MLDEIYQVEYVPSGRFRNAPSAQRYIRSIMSHETALVQVIALAPLLATYLNDTDFEEVSE